MSKITSLTTKGFTIVELIVVIVVISILASITYIGYSSYQNNAKATQYETDVTAIINKAEALASEGIAEHAYPTSANDFPTSASAHVLPAGVGVTFTSAASNAITNTSEQVASAPTDGANTSIALNIVNTTNKRVYTAKSCGSGAGIIVFYPDPSNQNSANAAVKSLRSGVTTGC